MDFETGYHPEILGEYAERQQSKNRLLAMAALSIIGIFLILYADFDSLRLSLLVILCLPIQKDNLLPSSHYHCYQR